MELKSAYTVGEAATLTGFSRQTITRMFAEETGVLKIERPGTRNKRRYTSLRIPRHVYERVIRRYTVR